MRSIACLLILMLGIATLAQDPDWVSTMRDGDTVTVESVKQDSQGEYKAVTNWSSGFMEFEASATCDMSEATNPGQCESMAKKAARFLAYARAAELLSGVSIEGMVGLSKELVKADIITGKYSGFIKGARVLSETFEWKTGPGAATYGWATVRIGILLYGAKSGDQNALDIPLSAVVEALTKSGYTRMETSEPPVAKASAALEATPVTGIILDASGLNARPTLTPLVAVQGNEKKMVYSGSTVGREYAVKTGVAGYCRTIEQAKADERLKADGIVNPLVIKVAAVENNILYVSVDDAAKMVAANMRHEVLDKCRVVIVMG